MDKNKLIELLKDAWNDGNSQYHECKYSHEYKQDLENWLDSNEDEINELCDGKNVEASDSNCTIHGVTVSLPSDKVIEDWYTKYFDSLTLRFWEEAPYCTHGDRVEEIKDAVHYFITGNER